MEKEIEKVNIKEVFNNGRCAKIYNNKYKIADTKNGYLINAPESKPFNIEKHKLHNYIVSKVLIDKE